jgi:hypothetical protein
LVPEKLASRPGRRHSRGRAGLSSTQGRCAENTGTQLGASIGTALAGAVLISALTASFLTGIAKKDLEAALKDAYMPTRSVNEIVQPNEQSRIDGLRAAVSLLALIALLALPFTRGIPKVQPGAAQDTT